MSQARLSKKVTSVLSTVAVVIVAVLAWWLQNNSADTTRADDAATTAATASSTHASPSTSPSPAARSGGASYTSESPDFDGNADDMPVTDPDSGLPYVALDQLPPEAGETVALIDAGGPFPYDEDGSRFGNYEGILPDEDDGYYQEYTVETPGLSHRGARRIVRGAEGEFYWTEDHYESFERIWR